MPTAARCCPWEIPSASSSAGKAQTRESTPRNQGGRVIITPKCALNARMQLARLDTPLRHPLFWDSGSGRYGVWAQVPPFLVFPQSIHPLARSMLHLRVTLSLTVSPSPLFFCDLFFFFAIPPTKRTRCHTHFGSLSLAFPSLVY